MSTTNLEMRSFVFDSKYQFIVTLIMSDLLSLFQKLFV